MKKILIIGASGHARVIIDIIEKQGEYEILGLIDSYKKIGFKVYNYEVLGTENDIPKLMKQHQIHGGIIAIGDNFTRMDLYNKITAFKETFHFISAIHPHAVIGKNVHIQDGTVVMAGVIINSDSEIGKQCIVNTKSSIGHDTILNDFSSIAPGATIGGNTVIGYSSAISLGVNIIGGISIGKHTVVGAGSLVNKDIDDYKVVYGVPAKEIRERHENDPYLN